MAKSARGTRATQPPAGYERPQLTTNDGLRIRIIDTDGNTQEYGFEDLTPHTPLLRMLVQGFARGSGPGGRWVSADSVRTRHANLRAFYRYLQSLPTPPKTIEDLSPAVWLEWRETILRKHAWPGVINGVRALLNITPGVPEDTKEVMRRKNRKPKARVTLTAMSRDEFKRVKARAWKIVASAARRIRANSMLLEHYRTAKRDGCTIEHRDDVIGAALQELSTTGFIGPRSRAALDAAGYGEDAPDEWALFLTRVEAFAGMVLLVALRGYNPKTVKGLEVTHHRPDGGVDSMPIRSVPTTKARRGGRQGRSVDTLVGTGRRSTRAVYDLLTELTDPARRLLEARGSPTTALFIARLKSLEGSGLLRLNTGASLTRGGAPSHRFKEAFAVLDDTGEPLDISLQRVRLTEQVVNQSPRFNSERVHDEVYVLPDKSIEPEAARTILAGKRDAIEHARVTLQLRTWTEEDLQRARANPDEAATALGVPKEKLRLLLAGALNTPVGACVDYDHSPFSDAGPCRASFLMCFACPNAIATPQHLPRLVCLHDALMNIGSAVTPDVWNDDYDHHFERLNHLLNTQFSQSERSAARSRITVNERQAIERLLKRGFDA